MNPSAPGKPLVLYHDNCPDGFGAALAAWLRFGDEAEYRGVNYGQAPPDDWWARDLYILDFSYPREALARRGLDESYLLNVTDFRVLDHHKTAQADLAGLSFATFDLARSGAGITWDVLHQGAARPPLIDYVEDRDLWRWTLPESREVSVALWSLPRTFVGWSVYLNDVSRLAEDGVAILRYQQSLVRQMATQTVWREIGGHRVPVVNASVCFSEVGEHLCLEYPEAPFAAYYFDRADGNRQWGTRSCNGFDCSVVAKGYGGGGHPGAAGWTERL